MRSDVDGPPVELKRKRMEPRGETRGAPLVRPSRGDRLPIRRSRSSCHNRFDYDVLHHVLGIEETR